MFGTSRRKSLMHKLMIPIILLITLQTSLFLADQKIQSIQLSKAFGNYEQEVDLNGFNVTLCVKDWEEETSFEGLKVTIYDLREEKASTHFSNRMGYVELKFIPPGSYTIFVQKG